MKKRRHARGMVCSGLFKSNWPDLCLDLFATPKSVIAMCGFLGPIMTNIAVFVIVTKMCDRGVEKDFFASVQGLN